MAWLGWLHIFSDVGIWLSYLAIPAMLTYFTRIRDVPYSRLFWLFSAFIVFCGTTHLMEAIIFWWPAYGLAGLLKFGTAIVSITTAVVLSQTIPQALALRSPEQLESEIAQRTKELEASRQQAMAIVEASPIGQIVVDNKGIIVLANPAVLEIFGYSSIELVGASIDTLVPEPERSTHPRHRANFSRQPTTRKMGEGQDLHGLHKSGKKIPVEVGLTPIDTGDGSAVLCSIMDLSERKNAEEAQRQYTRALSESASKLRGVIDNSENLIGLLDVEGTVLEMNQTALQTTGVDAGEIANCPCWEAPWMAHSPEIQDRMKQAVKLAASGERDFFEGTHVTKDGALIEVDISVTPVEDNHNNVVFLIKEAHDVTEHKRRETELTRLNDQLTTSNRELEQFAYVASHDLQEPLRKITSYAQLLLEDAENLNPDARRDIDVVIDGAERLKVLVGDLLTFSRVTTLGRPLSIVDANECLQAALENLELTIQESNSVITCDTFPAVVADAGQLTRLFQNLISNAIKYCDEARPTVHIGNRVVDSQVECFVKDNGLGIEPRYFDKVFEIFQRLHGRTAYSGTGIGLAICKRIVERFGGRIWVDSDGKSGTTFYFTLNMDSQGAQA